MAKRAIKKNRVVIKNRFIRSRWELSALEHKLAFLVISKVNPKDPSYGLKRIGNAAYYEFDFKVRDVLKAIGEGRNNWEYVFDVAKRMRERTITIQEDDGPLATSIICEAKVTNGETLSLTIPPHMVPYLFGMQSGNYTSFLAENIFRLNSKYSQAMYRFLKSFHSQRIITKTLAELREFLCLDENEYADFRNFRRRVLDVAQEELAAKTDIEFDWRPDTARGQKIRRITFTIKDRLSKEERERREAALASLRPQVEAELEDTDELERLHQTRRPKNRLAPDPSDNPVRKAVKESLRGAKGKTKEPTLF